MVKCVASGRQKNREFTEAGGNSGRDEKSFLRLPRGPCEAPVHATLATRARNMPPKNIRATQKRRREARRRSRYAESPEVRHARRVSDAALKAKRRAAETQEQRGNRLADNAALRRRHRSAETQEQRRSRLADNTALRRRHLAAETQEQRNHRLVNDAALQRADESPPHGLEPQMCLSALTQTDSGQDSLQEDGHVCEDHFLSEDVLVPISSPSLEEQPGVGSSWGAPLSEEEEEQEQQEEADRSNIHDDKDVLLSSSWPPDDQEWTPKKRSRMKRKRHSCPSRLFVSSFAENLTPETIQKKQRNKSVPKKSLMQRFLQLLQAAPGHSVNVHRAAHLLGCRHQRLNEFRNVMSGLQLLKPKTTAIKWTSKRPIISFLMRYETFQDELQLQEKTLDALIGRCSERLFAVTDDRENAAMAYVTHADIGRIPAFQDQTVIVVKAPDGTTLKVPEPEEDRIQVHLKGAGPITALTCDLSTEERSGFFVSLEESRMKTMTMGSQGVCS